jgi:Fanconi anemia group M protein
MIDTQKLLKPYGKILIVVDYREREIISLLKNLGAIIKEDNLPIGDFVVSSRTAIERKSHSDFISSIIDGRIFEQMENMQKYYEKRIVLIEGYSDRFINENAYKAAVATLATSGITLLSTKSHQDTAKTIFWIAKKEQQENKIPIAVKVGKKPVDSRKQKEFLVSSIPGISSVLAQRLLKEFGSVEKIFVANEEELKKVKGLKEKTAKSIRKLITTKY